MLRVVELCRNLVQGEQQDPEVQKMTSPTNMGMHIMRRSFFRYKRICFVAFVLFFCSTIAFLRSQSAIEMENLRTAEILAVVQTSTEAVVLPQEDTSFLQPSESHKCQDMGAQQYLLLMFISSPENRKRRQVIRKVLKDNVASWEQILVAQNPLYAFGTAIKSLFFVGQPSNGQESVENLLKEGKEYGDLVLDDFQESYLNLTVKTLRMLKWVEGNCPQVAYLVKIDDDVFLNVPLLLNFLHNDTLEGQDLITGHVYSSVSRDEDPYSKWYTPKILWSKPVLPDFVAGFCYVLGSRVRANLYYNALKAHLFHLEDVFLTGIVRETYLSVGVVNISPTTYKNWSPASEFNFPCTLARTAVIIHPLSISQLKCYNQLNSLCKTHPYIPLRYLC